MANTEYLVLPATAPETIVAHVTAKKNSRAQSRAVLRRVAVACDAHWLYAVVKLTACFMLPCLNSIKSSVCAVLICNNCILGETLGQAGAA